MTFSTIAHRLDTAKEEERLRLEEEIIARLVEQGRTVAVAESCTGGLIGQVEKAEISEEIAPLIFFRGRYTTVREV
jgi:hypothetical protein